MAQLSWLALLPIAAYWSVWADYGARVLNDPQSLAHPVAALAGVLVLWKPAASPSAVSDRAAFWLTLSCALSFALFQARLTAMPRCALALLGFGSFLWWQRGSARPWLGLSLMLLGLPLLGQLELLLGFTLRLSVAEASAALVRATGLSIAAEGTRLAWAGGFVDVDAPCSGLRMHWTGSFVALLAIAHFELRPRDGVALALCAPLLIWIANVLRCAALFYVEAGIVPAHRGMHTGIGLVVFCGVCLAVWEAARLLVRRRLACAPS